MKAAPIVNAQLPHRLSLPGSKWQVRSPDARAMVERAAASLDAIERGQSGNIRMFKQSERKVVFAFGLPGSADAFVAKVAWLHTWKRLLEYRRFALREAANLFTAASRGVAVPRVEAVGTIRGRFGLPRRTVLIIECLRGYTAVKELLTRGPESVHAAVLDATLPAFESLYRTGCNHLDLNSGNIMIPDAGAHAAAPVMLDLQYATFADTPSEQMLMFQAGWFAQNCLPMTSRALIDAWFDRLLDRVGLKAQAASLRPRFEHNLAHRPSREERLQMR